VLHDATVGEEGHAVGNGSGVRVGDAHDRRLTEPGVRLRALLTIDDEIGVFCPECAEHEFGEP
jgi:hypothetical protein